MGNWAIGELRDLVFMGIEEIWDWGGRGMGGMGYWKIRLGGWEIGDWRIGWLGGIGGFLYLGDVGL